MTVEFRGFPKIARLSRDCVISEKLDGTNAQIMITPVVGSWEDPALLDYWYQEVLGQPEDGILYGMYAGSRTRWLTEHEDNYGFWNWAKRNLEELKRLGPGSHFGEWWGKGIQRNYGLKEKRFSLFNTSRWFDDAVRPVCCHVVPVLHNGPFMTGSVDIQLESMRKYGSIAAPGFMKPEGVVVFHTASGHLYKKTIEKDEKPKGASE